MSVTTQLCWVVSWVLWVVYAVKLGALPKIITDAGGLLFDVAVTVLLCSLLLRTPGWGANLRHAGGLAVLGGAGCLLAWHLWGLVGLAGALLVFDASSLIPAVVAVWRAGAAAGVSLSAWVMRSVTGTGWILYGVSIGVPMAGGYAWIMAPAGILVTSRLILKRRKAQVEVPSLTSDAVLPAST